MSQERGTRMSVIFISSHGSSMFPHPMPLPLEPFTLRRPASVKNKLYLHALLGLTSFASYTSVAPLERVHLLMQNQNEMIKSGSLSSPYKGMKDCFLRTIKQDGIISLWRGNSMNFFKAFTTHALAFTIGKNAWHDVGDNKDDKNGSAKFLAATWSARFIQYPLDYAHTRLATDVIPARKAVFSLDSARKYFNEEVGTRKFTGILDLWNKTLKLDGISGFYRGCNLSVLGILAWELSKENMMARFREKKKGSTWLAQNLPTVMLYSLPVAFYPLTNVSRRMMINSGDATTKYKNSIHAINEIIKHEGFCSLYKGVTAGMVLCLGRGYAVYGLIKLGLFLNYKINS